MQPPSLHTRKKDKEDSTMVHYFHSDIAQKYGINAASFGTVSRARAYGSRSYTRARFGFAARYRC